MKYLLTLSALALTIPAIGMAESHADSGLERGQQQKEQSRSPEHAQQRQGESQRADQQRQQQAGQRKSQDRLTRLDRNHITLSDLKDTSIVNRQDEEIGTVSDIILDQEGRVAAVIVTSGGMMGVGSKTRAVSWEDVQVRAKSDEDDEYTVSISMSKQEFESLAEFEAERRTSTAGR